MTWASRGKSLGCPGDRNVPSCAVELTEVNRDIVDMEPANGNVLKMLTGAILKEFDRAVTKGSSP